MSQTEKSAGQRSALENAIIEHVREHNGCDLSQLLDTLYEASLESSVMSMMEPLEHANIYREIRHLRHFLKVLPKLAAVQLAECRPYNTSEA